MDSMTFRLRWCLLGVSLFLWLMMPASFALAATIYANSSTGNDTTGNGSSGSPYKTFHKAYTVASSTDTIDLTGTFDWNSADETGDSTTTGYTIAKSLTIRGQGADQTFVQASSSAYTASRGVFVISGSGISVTIQDLTVRYGYNTVDSGAAGIHVSSASTVTLDAVAITENASNGRFGVSGLRIANSGTTTVQNSVIHNNDAIAARTQTGAS